MYHLHTMHAFIWIRYGVRRLSLRISADLVFLLSTVHINQLTKCNKYIQYINIFEHI